MNQRASEDTHLSIGFYSPYWPSGASPNGVLTYVGLLSQQLKAMSHQTTILAQGVAESDQTSGVYNLQEVRTTIARNPVNRIMYGLWRSSRSIVPTRICTVERWWAPFTAPSRSTVWTSSRWKRHMAGPDGCRKPPGFLFACGCMALGFRSARHSGLLQMKDFENGSSRKDGQFRMPLPLRRLRVISLQKPARFYGLELRDAEVIPNPTGPATEHWRLDRADPWRVLFVGRFDRLKGGDLIIDAFARVLQEVPGTSLVRWAGPRL